MSEKHVFAAERRKDNNQTWNVWTGPARQVFALKGRKSTFTDVLPHLQCGNHYLAFPDVARLAIIFGGSAA